MADVDYTYDSIDDASIGYNGTSNYSTGSGATGWIWYRNHGATTHRSYVAQRYQIPDSITIADINAATVTVEASSATQTFYGVLSVVEDVNDALSSSSPNRPSDIYSTANGSIDWDATAVYAAGDSIASGDFTTALKAALNAGTATGGYYNIAVVWLGDNTPSGGMQVKSVENTSTAAPQLNITVAQPAVPGGLTITAPSATASLAPATSLTREDVDYDSDSSRTQDRRKLDIREPVGAAPAGGRPLMVFVHGGSFVGGSEDSVDADHLRLALLRGYTFVSVRYTISDSVGTYNTNTHPMPVQDLGAALKFVDTELNVDMAELVLSAYSAGGHLAMEYALTHNDQTEYDWVYTGPVANDRNDNEPLVSPKFDFTQGRTGLPTPKGIFLWDAPTSITKTLAHNSLFANAARGYLGGLNTTAFYISSTEHEADLDNLITGQVGTDSIDSMWEGNLSHRAALASMPIGYIEARYGTNCAAAAAGTNGVTIGQAAGIQALKASITDVGGRASDSTTVNGLSALGGLSHWRNQQNNLGLLDYPHDKVYVWDDYTELTSWLDWLDAHEVKATTAVTAAATVSSVTVTTATNASTTTTAPSVAAATGTPTTATTANASTTTTAPSVAAAAGVAVASKSESRIATITAPSVAAATGVAAGSGTSSSEATPTAPSVAASTGTADVSVSAAVSVTAPSVAIATGTPSASSASAGAVTTAAPSVAAATGAAVATVAVDADITTTAPAVISATGQFTMDATAAISAPVAAIVVGSGLTVTVAESDTIFPAAPSIAASAPTPDVSIIQNSGILVTAATMAALAPTPQTSTEEVVVTQPDYNIVFHTADHPHRLEGNRGQAEVLKQAVTDLVGPYVPVVTSSSTASSNFGDGISFTVTSSQSETRWYIDENDADVSINWSTGVLTGGSSAIIGDHILSIYGATVFGITPTFALTWSVS